MKFANLFNEFTHSEKAGGIVLLFCTIFSFALANSSMGTHYTAFWHHNIDLSIGPFDLNHSIIHWINDGLMTIFFLLIGLEIEREVYVGELKSIRSASFPMAGALGGMIVPALIYLYFNNNTPTANGYGIPMATDIAFALGILALLGKGVPHSLKIFLTALAIIDDLGSIVIIGLFYNKGINGSYLIGAIAIFGGLLIMNRLKINKLIFYILPGIVLWYCMLKSGVHPTLAGILLAFAIPFGKHDIHNISYQLQHWLHKPVAFIVLPLFALANTAIVLTPYWYYNFSSPQSIGIILGLVLGKPIGIFIFCWILIKINWGSLPADVNLKMIAGTGILSGIGFTMSIFIANLAFQDEGFIQFAKVAVLAASLLSSVLGLLFLWLVTRSKNPLATDKTSLK